VGIVRGSWGLIAEDPKALGDIRKVDVEREYPVVKLHRRVHIEVYGPFIERHSLGGAPDLSRQVASPIEQCDIGVVVGRQLVDALAVQIQGLPPLLVLFEGPSLSCQEFNTSHKAALILASDLPPGQTNILTPDEREDGIRPDYEA